MFVLSRTDFLNLMIVSFVLSIVILLVGSLTFFDNLVEILVVFGQTAWLVFIGEVTG